MFSIGQSTATFNGSMRGSGIVSDYNTTYQVGTTTNSIINLPSKKGVQHFPLDFDKAPKLLDTTLNYYEIGRIPDQTVISGGLLHFYVKCDSIHTGTKSYKILPTYTPGGVLYFKPTLQYFHFEPLVADTVTFYIYFSATNGTDTITQKVLFKTYKPASVDNYAFGVGNGQQIPNPEDNEYKIVTTINNYTPQYFNGINKRTRSIAISAIDLYAENTSGNLLMSLSGNLDIKQLDIYAERLFIRDTLNLPQTNVNIYCKELYFEDISGHAKSVINTTPKTWPTALPGSPGLPGATAGTINVFASKIIDDSGGIRFRLIGGDGQSTTNAQAGSGGNGGRLFSNLDIGIKGDYLEGLAGTATGTGTPAANYKGIVGSFSKDSITARWIHPNYIRQILAYSNDAYYLGYGNQVLPKLTFYNNLINLFTESNEFTALDDYTQSDLIQVNMELSTLSNQIISGLDYFGNQPGWVPLLSFEFTQAAFESELHHTMQILYLNYFISSAADTIQKRIDGYSSLRDELKAQSMIDENNLNDLVLVKIPECENKIAENNQTMLDLSNQIKDVMQQIQDRADKALKDLNQPKDKRPKWEKIAGAVGQVATMVPYPPVQAAGAGVVSGLQFYDAVKQIDNYDVDHLPQIVAAGSSAYETYTGYAKGFEETDTSWSRIGREWQDFFPAFQGSLGINGLKTQAKKGVKLFKDLKTVYQNLHGVYDNFLKVDNSDLRKIRSDLMANDPTLAQLNENLKEAADNHKRLVDEYSSTNHQIQSLASEIVATSIAFDDANTKVLNNVKVMDHRTVQYIQYLRRDAIRRLKKYNYYMAKAFEFRTLQPYTGNLNMTPILNSAETMAIASNNGILTSQQYTSLADLYRNQISQIAENIYDYYVSNAPSQTIKTSYIIPKTDIIEMNKGNNVVFNAVNRGIFSDNEENVRIVNLRVRSIKDSVGNGTLGSPSKIDVRFEYPNVSYIKSKGKVYYFNNYNLNTTTPLSWSSRYDKSNGSIIDFKPSAATSSLLKSLLLSQSLPTTNNDLLMYSRPSAGAELLMSSTYQNNGGSAGLYIDSLVVEIEYDFNVKPANISYLNVLTEPSWIVPQYIVSKNDNNSMQDGQGDMMRTFNYSAANNVIVNTQNRIGGYRFERWLDRYGNPLRDADSINPIRTFRMNQDVVFNKVKYKWAGPILVLPDTLYFTPSQTVRPLFVDNQGESDMFWLIDTVKGRLSISGNIRQGHNDLTLSVSIQAPPRDTLWYIAFTAPEAQNAIDTVWINFKIITKVNDISSSVNLINVYPNPANEQLFIENNGIPITEINIYDISGILVLKEKPPRDKWIDISGLQNGIYIAEIKTNNSTVMKKWIKM